MDIDTSLQQDIDTTLGLGELNEGDKAVLLKELGALALESALLSYLLQLDAGAQANFESWIEEHAQDEDFLEQLLSLYPVFENILNKEIEILQIEAATALDEVSA